MKNHFKITGSKTWKISHVLRNVIALHVFIIYERYGLRVPIPTYLLLRCSTLYDWFSSGFMKQCEYLKKELPDGTFTATNVPFIIAFIVVLIQKEIIYMRAEIDGKFVDMSELFVNRTGDIIPMEKYTREQGRKPGLLDTNEMWYFKHIKIMFGWVGTQGSMFDLETLFQDIVYGVDPFETSVFSQDEEDQVLNIFYNSRMRGVMQQVELEEIDKVLRITKAEAPKEKKKPAFNGWLSGKEMAKMKEILKDKSIAEDSVKRERLHQEMIDLQHTYMAKVVNIGMHLALWAPTITDIQIAAENSEAPSPLVRMTDVKEDALNLLKVPSKTPSKGRKRKGQDREVQEETPSTATILEFPMALTKMTEDLVQRTNKLVGHCRDLNTESLGVQTAYEKLCKLINPPTLFDVFQDEAKKYDPQPAQQTPEQAKTPTEAIPRKRIAGPPTPAAEPNAPSGGPTEKRKSPPPASASTKKPKSPSPSELRGGGGNLFRNEPPESPQREDATSFANGESPMSALTVSQEEGVRKKPKKIQKKYASKQKPERKTTLRDLSPTGSVGRTAPPDSAAKSRRDQAKRIAAQRRMEGEKNQPNQRKKVAKKTSNKTHPVRLSNMRNMTKQLQGSDDDVPKRRKPDEIDSSSGSESSVWETCTPTYSKQGEDNDSSDDESEAER
jgi:hypothetical protein